LDIDGVLADFVGGVERVYGPAPRNNSWEIHEWYGMPSGEFWKGIDTREFWAGLAPLPYWEEMVTVCGNNGTVFLCSAPALSPECQAGKMEWIQRHFGQGYRSYIFAPRKELLAAPGRVLIDDNDENIRRFRDYGGSGIVYPQPWNSAGAALESQKVKTVKLELEIYGNYRAQGQYRGGESTR